MQTHSWLPRLAAAALGLAVTVGCGGGETVPVSGTVTLDGEPLDGATIVFTPQEGGRPSAARTDSNGYYNLVYGRGAAGAVPGEHLVTISTYIEEDTDSDPEDALAGSAERVPARYNVNSELVENVEYGRNTIDFDLDSEGEIIELNAGGYGGY